MECISYKIKLAGETLSLYAIYHVPSTSVLQFCGKLPTLLEQVITHMHGKVLLVGDFNIHIDKKATPDTSTFNDMLEGLNLRNNIEMEMHTSGHVLNLIINDCKDSLVIATKRGHQILDHCFIHSTLHIKKPKLQIKITSYGKLKNMNSSKFQEDIQSNLTTADEGLSPEEMVDH